jgi:hypothetical protein
MKSKTYHTVHFIPSYKALSCVEVEHVIDLTWLSFIYMLPVKERDDYRRIQINCDTSKS